VIAIATLLVVVLLALLVARIATVALIATGLPFEVARFQARSALTGVGFTTQESESVVNHPIRRRIILTLMLLGNAGFVTILASLIFSFAGTASTGEVLVRLAIILAGMLPIMLVARSQRFARWLTRMITRALNRWSDLDVRDMVNLMQLTSDYAITELQVKPGDWVADKPLANLHLPDEGVLVLGIQRADGSFVGAPRGATVIHAYDMLVLYGRSAVLADLDARPDDVAGDRAHKEAVVEQEHIMADVDEGVDRGPAET
jgi:hypothetical protein